MLIPESVEAFYWFEQAARQGHPTAQYEQGKLLLSSDPEDHDSELGIRWLECAAHNKKEDATYRLGKEYLKGNIVPTATVKAAGYLTQSAEVGNQYTQYALGKLYLDRHDQEQVHSWFTQSAAQSNSHAQFFLDRWYNLKPPSVMLTATRLLYHYYPSHRQDQAHQTDLPRPPKALQRPDGKWPDPRWKNQSPGLSSTTVRGIHLMFHCVFERAPSRSV